MKKLLEEQRQIQSIYFVGTTAVIASIGPGSIVSRDSYNSFPIMQIVRINNANTLNLSNTKYSNEYALREGLVLYGRYSE